ncbi:hypothetical protein ACQRWG_16040 [Stenotrophomonas maltophilia]
MLEAMTPALPPLSWVAPLGRFRALRRETSCWAPERIMEKHRNGLAKFFNDLVKHDKIDRSPIHCVSFGYGRDEEEPSRRLFTDEELGKNFEPIRFKALASKAPYRWFGLVRGFVLWGARERDRATAG